MNFLTGGGGGGADGGTGGGGLRPVVRRVLRKGFVLEPWSSEGGAEALPGCNDGSLKRASSIATE